MKKKRVYKSKYNNIKVVIDGIKFDSILESNIYLLLKSFCNKNNLVLERQVKFCIFNNGKSKRYLIPDFKIGNIIIEVKSKATEKNPSFRLKKELFLEKFSKYNFQIVKSIPECLLLLQEFQSQKMI